jgi:outer membrane murein-binding lipoprotein Lpp
MSSLDRLASEVHSLREEVKQVAPLREQVRQLQERAAKRKHHRDHPKDTKKSKKN